MWRPAKSGSPLAALPPLLRRCRVVRVLRMTSTAPSLPSLSGMAALPGIAKGIKMLLAQSESPLKIMVTNGEITSGSVAAPEGQNILSTATLKLKVRIVPLGKLSYIENELAFSNPALGGAS